MAAATEIEKRRAAAAEEQAAVLREIRDQLARIEALLVQPVSAAKGRAAPPRESQE